MDLIEGLHSRRSIRSYEPTSVQRELIERIILDATQAPPPTRDQVPWTFNIVEGAERIATYGEEAKKYAKDNHPAEPGWNWVDRLDFKVFWDAPVVIIISGPVEDCCRAGQNLMLSAHARGLGTCWVGAPMLWLRTAAVKSELGIPSNLTPVSALCMGYAREVPPPPPRGRPTIIWCNEMRGWKDQKSG